MSYINRDTLKLQPRRHRIKRLTPEEAIEAANKVVDKANEQIAFMAAQVGQFEQVARTYEAENRELRAANEALKVRVAELEGEVERLRRKVTRKSGKRKGVEFEDEE